MQSLLTSVVVNLNSSRFIFSSWTGCFLLFAACATFHAGVAFCQSNGYSLMIQKSPPKGGIVTPDVGVRETAPNETVLMTATPRKGYRFLYWLGDVEDPTRGHTSVMVDSPKMVVAVFERVGYESLSSSGGGGGGGRGGLVYSSSYIPRQASISSGPSPEPGPRPQPIPVPPVPEPISFVLFGSGLYLLRAKRVSLRRS